MEEVFKQLVVYGPLGIICGYFLTQDSADRKVNREVLKSMGERLTEISKAQHEQEIRLSILEQAQTQIK